jgi:hypothetical protein
VIFIFILSVLAGDVSVGGMSVGGNDVGVPAGPVDVVVGDLGADVWVGVARDAVDIGGAMVDGSGVRVCVGAQAVTIATRIMAPNRSNSLAMRRLIFVGERLLP